MKRAVLLVVGLIATWNGQLCARIGNTEDQVAELYGKPINQGEMDKNAVITNTYHKGDYLILVQLFRGCSIAESYTRADKHEFSENELSTFLEASAGGQEWEKDPNRLAWERSDHGARAWCETLAGRPTLLIQAH
jgi:hypothetical protein